MSRRAANAGISGFRRQSIVDSKVKRVSLKDTSLGTGIGKLVGLAEVKDGDTFYRTERLYPSIPDHPADISVSVTRCSQSYARENRSGSTVSLAGRDDATTPDIVPSENRDRLGFSLLLLFFFCRARLRWARHGCHNVASVYVCACVRASVRICLDYTFQIISQKSSP